MHSSLITCTFRHCFVLLIPLTLFLQGAWSKDITISGRRKQEALDQLQLRVSKALQLSMDSTGKLSYIRKRRPNGREARMTMADKELAKAIDDSTIDVRVITIEGEHASDGRLLIGGGFMGDEYTGRFETTSGKPSSASLIIAKQEVNVNLLTAISLYYDSPGDLMLHEVIEAYAGGRRAQRLRRSILSRFGPDYLAAHSVIPQMGVYQRQIKDGRPTTDTTDYDRVEIFLMRPDKPDSIIWQRTNPQKKHS